MPKFLPENNNLINSAQSLKAGEQPVLVAKSQNTRTN